jgi:NAD(P)-dependent dehydrogenase (short-subunit alcohol dehydrogenase family)
MRDMDVCNMALLTGPDSKVEFHQLDITKQSSVDAFAKWLQDTYQGTTVLVNNAGAATSFGACISANPVCCYWDFVEYLICYRQCASTYS